MISEMRESAPRTELFGIQVYTFGLFCALGALVAAAAILILSRAGGKKKGTGLLLACLSILFGTAGARLFFCLLNFPGYGSVPFNAWFSLQDGGFSLFGMIFGTFLGTWICARITGENAAAMLDISACALPLMIAAERIGERYFDGFNVSRSVIKEFPAGTFLAVEDEFYGTSALATWKLSAILAVLLFLILVFRLTARGKRDGDQWILFMMLCGAGGVILESLRYDYHLEYSFVYLQQIIAALMLLWGLILAGRRSGKKKPFYGACILTFILAAAVSGGVEFALDRMNINHIVLYLLMTAALAAPVSLGILMLTGKDGKGTENR